MEKKIIQSINTQKVANIQFILNHNPDTVEFDLFIKEELEDFNKSEYEAESNDNSSEDKMKINY